MGGRSAWGSRLCVCQPWQHMEGLEPTGGESARQSTSTHPFILPSSLYSSDQHLLRPTLHKALRLAQRTCAEMLSLLGCAVDMMTPP